METALEFDKCLSVAVQTLEYERQQVILEVNKSISHPPTFGRCLSGAIVVSQVKLLILFPIEGSSARYSNFKIEQVYSVHRWLNHHTPPLYWWFPVRTKPETHNSR
ncbi:hypothetical protein M513_13115 [Trichuris suis]|uniref:Uncharacterized protein n=1 Tax=Trichuris suis TaxID=68888 RepID=A0A085LM17_9BILA|nr:hypothetical protein M513_13115 [Trichuris suis]